MSEPSSQKRKPLRRALGWLFIANVIFAVAMGSIQVALGKFTDPASVGDYYVAFSISIVVSALLNLDIRQALYTDVKESFAFASYLRLRIITVPIALVIPMGICAALYQDSYLVAMVAAAAANHAVVAFRELWIAATQRAEKLRTLALGNIIEACSAAGPFCVILYLYRDPFYALWGMFAGRIIATFLFDIRFARKILGPEAMARAAKLGDMKRLLRQVFPLGINRVLITLTTQMPVFFMEGQGLGRDQIGIFRNLQQLTVIMQLVGLTVIQAYVSRLALMFADEPQAFKSAMLKLLVGSFVLGVCFVVGCLALGEWGIEVVYQKVYALEHDTFVILALGAAIGLLNAVFAIGIAATRRFKKQAFATVILAVTMLAVIPYAISEAGLEGAAWALVIAMSAATVTRVVLLTGIYKARHDP